MNENVWADQFHDLINNAKEASTTAQSLKKWAWENVVAHDVIPVKMGEPLASLFEQIDQNLKTIERVSTDLFLRFFKAPVEKFLLGYALTREEFYLLMAMDVDLPIISAKMLDLSSWDGYEFFRLFRYENDLVRCYINPGINETELTNEAGVKSLGLKFGHFPEVLDRDGLRPEQHEFFKTKLPELYARFSSKPPVREEK